MFHRDPSNIDKLVDHLFRHQAGKMISVLIRLFGIYNLEMAEDVVQDTMRQALLDWSLGNIPDNPEAWLMAVAKRKAINCVRRDKYIRHFAAEYDHLLKSDAVSADIVGTVFLEHEIKDSQLRMIFTCCNPMLSTESQVALTLKTLCGFSIPEIACSLLTNEDTVNKRLYRAKEKIRNSNIPFEIPKGKELYQRLDAVYLIIYLIFNEGYNSISDDLVIRKDLCWEAMRLAGLLLEKPLDQHPKTNAILALMCFHAARFSSRLNDSGGIVILEEQDRELWDKALIEKGFSFLSKASEGDEISEYHVEAGIAAQHCLAKSFEETNWEVIYSLYISLEKIKPSPVIALNKAIIVGQLEGASKSIELLLELEKNKSLKSYYLLPASLGEFYLRVHDKTTAKNYFQQARSLISSKAGIELLDRKIAFCNAC
jgi:RNA polymerase sigma factor (sigma-70 family)